jgi:hypothetical protein
VNAATYIVQHPEFGWLAFGGNLRRDGDWIKVQPLDAFRQRVYVASLGLWLTLDSGTFESVEINLKTRSVRAGFSKATHSTERALLRIEQPAKVANVGLFRADEKLPTEREALSIKLQPSTTWIELKAN